MINERLRRDRRTPLDFDEIQETTGDTVGRPHLGRALVARGYARHLEDAFQRYLIPCNIPKRFFPLDQAIRLVHDCGGVAVMAHPLLVNADLDHWDRLLDGYASLGLDGIEVYTPGATESDIEFFLGQARRRGLVVTGGSDYHGMSAETTGSGTRFGAFAVPVWCLDEIKSALRARQVRYATLTSSDTRPTSSA
jgi:predicted metal-dependent phosphoesterase TrpH